MTDLGSLDAHEIITCPYNAAHQIERYRMQFHLKKCRIQYPHCDKVICPFDSTHIVNDVELDYHVTTCPKRFMLDMVKYTTDDKRNQRTEVISAEPAVAPGAEEDWDSVVTTSYKPNVSTMGSHVIKKVKGATPSERRKARMEGIKNYKPPV